MEWIAISLVGRVIGRVVVRLSDKLLDYLEQPPQSPQDVIYQHYHNDADLNSNWELIAVDDKLPQPYHLSKPVSK